MENNVKYEHCTPNRKERQVCSDMLSIVNELAPSDSFIEAHVDQGEDGSYRAKISVDAVHGNFKAESSDMSLLRSLKKSTERCAQYDRSVEKSAIPTFLKHLPSPNVIFKNPLSQSGFFFKF